MLLWIFAFVTFLETSFIILSVWGPIYLMMTQGQEFNWIMLIMMLARRIVGIFIIFMLYSYVYRHKFFFKKFDKLMRAILVSVYLISNLLLFNQVDFYFGPFQIMEIFFLIIIIILFTKTDKIINLYKNF